MSGLMDFIFGGDSPPPIPPPIQEKAETPVKMPDPDPKSQTKLIESRKERVSRSRARSGRRSTILSEDDKMGGN